MTRWGRASASRQRRGALNGDVSSGKTRGTRRAKGRSAVVVDHYDNLILLRSSPSTPPHPDGVAELARFLRGDEDGRSVFTIVVGAEGADAGLWRRFAAVLDSLRDRGITVIRLALSGAGADHPGRPALAQRIADAWGIEVIAPEASVLIVPGGSLFALGAEGADGGWRSFRPGAEPTPLGLRSPAPRWQPTFTRLPGRTAGGYVVEQVPAGISVRSAKAARTSRGDLSYAVPVDKAHPTVIVDVLQPSGEPPVPAEDIAALLAALPDATRSEVRLAPCGPADLLPVGQDAAEILGAEVEVLTGLPLLTGADSEPEVRPVLIGADSEPTWAPFVEAVACRPYAADGSAPAPRLVRWRSPLSGIRRRDSAAVPLSDRWQVCVTRAGLAVVPCGDEPPVAGRPVSAEQLAVEVNLRGAAADETLFTNLSQLLSEIGTDAREFVTLHRVLPPGDNGEDDFRMLRLAIEHGVSLAEPPPAETASPPATPNVRTVAAPRARASSEPAAAPAVHPPETADGLPAYVTSQFTALTPGIPSPARPASRAPVAPGSGDLAGPTSSGPFGPGGGTAGFGADGPAGSAAPPGRDFAGTSGPNSAPEPTGTPGAGLTNEPAWETPRGPERWGNPGKIPPAPVTPREPAAPVPPAQDAERARDARPSAPSVAAPGAPGAPGAPDETMPPAAPRTSESLTSPWESGSATRPTSAEPSAPRASANRPASTRPPASPTSSTSPGPAVPGAASTADERPGPVSAAPGERPRSVTKSVRRSTEAERAEFRTLAKPVWERHSAAVNRAMTRMPALRGPQVDAARTDLVAVHLYLSGGLDELGPRDAADGVPDGYIACLGSGLSRLPSYRGVAVRGGLSDGDLTRFVPGGIVREPRPVSALPIGAADGLPTAAGGYVIWSSTGRRVRPLLGAAPGAASDEVVFPPGAVFRVLDVRSAGQAPTVLLVEVVGGASAEDRPGGLSGADRAALDRLDEALRRHASQADGGTAARRANWPPRCEVPLGVRAGTA
ncbi:hypothetical protein [Actinoallomurus sp. NPDC050550]|uniref:hypothetical protein n=1 Tax=Actinoallomurus sp. NPDC050550 TaxID=3154937 RepID=UPI0033EE138C